MAAIQYNADDAGLLVQIADAANGDLQQTPFLPAGWNLLATSTSPGLGSPQFILASGTLPSGIPAAVLAFGAPAASFLRFYTVGVHALGGIQISNLLPPLPPPPPPPPPPPLIDNGFQSLYNRLRGLIGPSLTNFASQCPNLVTCGIGGPGALAQIAAIDFRVGGGQAPAFIKAVACYAFSTPPFVNPTVATTSVQTQLPDVYAGLFSIAVQSANGQTIDFFPTAPTAALGYAPLGQQIAVKGPLPAYDSPWYERSAAYYAGILAPTAAQLRPKPPADGAPAADVAAVAGYDPDLAYVLSQFCAAASEAFQHPALSPSIPGGWTLLGPVSNGAGQVTAVVYRQLNQVLVAFRGNSSFEETVQTLGNQNAQYVNFLPAPIIQKAGTVLQGGYATYMALRPGFRQALANIADLASVSLILTGHDSGGWVAIMAATDLMQGTGGTPALPTLKTAPQVYTFGTPVFGNALFTNFFTGNVTAAVYPVVRPGDVVANLFIPGYFTIGTPTALPGITDYDDLTYHPVISYISLLDPS
jgi:hypothetical protein